MRHATGTCLFATAVLVGIGGFSALAEESPQTPAPASAVSSDESAGTADTRAEPAEGVRPLRLSDMSFYLFAAVTVVSCLGVVFSANIVRSAVWLLGTLGSVALLYFLLQANFLAAVQLIVYAGGILVLIIFGIMLTSKSPYVRMAPSRGEVVGGSIVSLLLFLFLARVITSADWHESDVVTASDPDAAVIPVADLGKGLLTTYLVPFEVASVLLLVVMIGAAYLVRTGRWQR